MDKAQAVFEKISFWGVAPMEVKNKKELQTGKGYLKEKVNETVGAIAGAVKSVRKTERKAGVKPSGAGKFFGRYGAGMVVPFVGGPLGEYVATRKIQKYEKA